MPERRKYVTFAEFHSFYLREHSNRTSRRLHFIGSSIALLLLVASMACQLRWLAALALAQGYAFAWVDHSSQHNRPAAFRHPWFSFLGDWRMRWEVPISRIRF